MTEIRRIGTLEIDESPSGQRRIWLAQRVGWGVMAAVALVSLTGLFGGPGPLADVTAGNADGPLFIEYERFVRESTDARIKLHLRTTGEHAVVDIVDDGERERTDLREIMPEPAERALIPGGQRLTFKTPESGPLYVEIRYEPQTTGNWQTRVRYAGVEETLSMFAYP